MGDKKRGVELNVILMEIMFNVNIISVSRWDCVNSSDMIDDDIDNS